MTIHPELLLLSNSDRPDIIQWHYGLGDWHELARSTPFDRKKSTGKLTK
jgi:hypothetical protein